jgi:hypothetical protein
LIDPIEDKAEIELKDSKTTKRNKKNENPLKKIVFIVGSLQKKCSLHPRHFGINE